MQVCPSIAQLVERWTVEVIWLSIGRWFESGSKDYIFSFSTRRVSQKPTRPALKKETRLYVPLIFSSHC